jgi:hypothetical protein
MLVKRAHALVEMDETEWAISLLNEAGPLVNDYPTPFGVTLTLI